jgi:hypothetical protein
MKFYQNKLFLQFILILIFGLGFAVRMVDLKDPPLDFNPTRQLRSAIIARGLYYRTNSDADPVKRDLALDHFAAMERLEPPLVEHLVAATYRLMGGEFLWVSRIYTSIFWLIGASALYAVGQQMASSLAALMGVGYFLFMAFTIRASRSFQPDPGMVMLILLSVWALFQWSTSRSWKWAVSAGILGGLTALTKVAGAFFVGGSAVGIVLFVASNSLLSDSSKISSRAKRILFGLRDPQIWVIAGLMVAPAVLYYFLGIGEQSSGYFSNWTIISRWRDVLDPAFYMRWLLRVDDILVSSIVILSFVGSLVTNARNRALLWGLWGGYFFFGMTFPHHTVTHDYYHLPLTAIVGLSLAPIADLAIQKIRLQPKVVQMAFIGVVAIFFGANAWIGRSILVGEDFSEHPAFWQTVGNAFPADGRTYALTQDYGARIMYYGWRKVSVLPPNTAPENFEDRTSGASFFVVTSKNQFSPALRQYVTKKYPELGLGYGYQIFDLREKK